MIRAENYATASTFVKVIQRKLLASFFLDMVYMPEQIRDKWNSFQAKCNVASAKQAVVSLQ